MYAQLPFIVTDKKSIPPRKFWVSPPTTNGFESDMIGQHYADEFVSFMHRHRDHVLLGRIVSDMTDQPLDFAQLAFFTRLSIRTW